MCTAVMTSIYGELKYAYVLLCICHFKAQQKFFFLKQCFKVISFFKVFIRVLRVSHESVGLLIKYTVFISLIFSANTVF